MSKTTRVTAAVCSVLWMAACQPAPETSSQAPAPDMARIKAEIRALEDAWAAAATAKDVATIVDFYADDAISMVDDKPMLVGKAAIQSEIAGSVATIPGKATVVYETLDLFGDERRVTEVGRTTVTDSTGKVGYRGKYMAVWEYRDGKWRIIRDIANDDAKDPPVR